jgi:hypothetical protein
MVAAYLDGAFALRQAGPAATRAVETVVVHDLAPEGFEQLRSLQVDLQALSAWWRAKRRRR